MSSTLSANSPRILGRMPWSSNHCSSDRPSTLSPIGMRNAAPVERLGKTAAVKLYQLGTSEKGHPALPEEVIEGAETELRIDGAVAQDQVDLVERQLRQEPVRRPIDAGHPHIPLGLKGGSEQTMDHELGEGVGNPGDEPDHPAGRPAADDILKLPTE